MNISRNPSLIVTFLFVSLLSISISEARDASLLLYFPFDEGQGDKANDASGNGFVGVLQGGAKWDKGKFGKAVSCNGRDAYIEVEHDDRLNLTGDSTIEVWIYPRNVTGWVHVIGKGNDNNDFAYLVSVDPKGVVDFCWSKWGDALFCPTLEPEKWYHLAGVQEGKKRIFYVNGKVVAEAERAEPDMENDVPVVIGARGGPNFPVRQFFDSKIDEIAIYTRGLTKEEINLDIKKGVSAAVTPNGSKTTTWGELKAKADNVR